MGHNPIIWPIFFPKNYMKVKEIGPRGGWIPLWIRQWKGVTTRACCREEDKVLASLEDTSLVNLAVKILLHYVTFYRSLSPICRLLGNKWSYSWKQKIYFRCLLDFLLLQHKSCRIFIIPRMEVNKRVKSGIITHICAKLHLPAFE